MAPRLQVRKLVSFLSLLVALYTITLFSLSRQSPSAPQQRITGAVDQFAAAGANAASSLFSRYHESPIDIVLTASSSYTIGLYPLINSTLFHASPATRDRLRFHIVSANDDEAADVAHALFARFPKELRSDQIVTYGLEQSTADARLNGLKVWASYRSSALSQPIVYARYILPQLLPVTIEKAIYLDQDVLVRDDLSALWDINLEGKPLAAARLCRPSALWRKQFVLSKSALKDGNWDEATCTLNNGVLLYNLTAWRSSGLENGVSYTDQLFSWSIKNSEDKLYNLGSQPPFNLVFYRNFKVLEDRWNLMDIAGLKDESSGDLAYPWTRSIEEVESSSILHWNGVFKPWLCNSEGYYSELWTRYYPDFAKNVSEIAAVGVCDNLVLTSLPDSPSVEQFTVVIVAFARLDTILTIVKHLEHSLYIKEILVAWNNLDYPCPEELELPWVRCLQQKANLVHNRFLVWSEVTTEAVLHYDDDLLAPLEDLEAAFQIWRRHRDHVLGFEPRVIICDDDDIDNGVNSNKDQFAIDKDEKTAQQNCVYGFKLKQGYFDLVIGKLFFVSRQYMQEYFQQTDLVSLSSTAPCEDLAMSFLAAHHHHQYPADDEDEDTTTPRPPLLFKSNLTEIHSVKFAGLSQGIASGDWRNERSTCVQKLLRIYGGRRPGPQTAFYERDPVRRRVYKLPIAGRLDTGWCSDTHGSRPCRQPR